MYGKIFDTMYEGSLYGQWEAIVTMQQLIVLADADGVIDMTPQAIAGKTSIPLDIIQKGIEILSKPDPSSRTPDHDGVRIMLLDDHRDWGWFLVNYEKYLSKQDADAVRAGNRERKRRQREREKQANGVTVESQGVTDGHGSSRHIDIDIDINNTHTSPSGDSEGDKSPTCPHQKIVDLYHKHCPDLPRVRTWEGQRKENLRQRFRTHSNLEWWEWFFTVINTLDFYNGRLEGKTWRANLDWIVKHSNFQKLVDICYERTEEQVA